MNSHDTRILLYFSQHIPFLALHDFRLGFSSPELIILYIEAGAAMKPDSEKSYLEQGKDMLAGKADVSSFITFVDLVIATSLTFDYRRVPLLPVSQSHKSLTPSR